MRRSRPNGRRSCATRGAGEFVWIGIHEPEPATSRAAGALRAARARGRGRLAGPPATEDRGLRRGCLHRPEDRPLPRGPRGRPLRRDPRVRRPRLRDHRSPRAGQRAHTARQSLERVPICSGWGRVGGLGDPRQGRRRLHPRRRCDRGRRRGGREGRLRRRHPGPDRPHLQPEARGDRVPSGGLAAAQPPGDAGAGRFRAGTRGAAQLLPRRRRPRQAASTSRSAPSASC